MDIVRTKKVKFYRHYKYYFLGIFIVVAAFFMQKNITSGEYAMNAEDIMIATVEKGDLSVKVRAPGVLTPKDIRWISSSVSGRAEKVWVKPGAAVKAGDLLFELSNPELIRSLEESRWELEAQSAESQAERINLEAQLLDQNATVLNAKFDYDTVAMRLNAELSLFNNGAQVISTLDHEKTKLEHKQTHQRWQIEKSRFNKMEERVTAQKIALAARLEKMRKILQSIEEQVESLKIRASIDSIVQEVAIEIGQQVAVANNLAKLAKQNELIAELQVPEMQIKSVTLGQSVLIDTRNNTIAGKIVRIAPAVNQNTVQVDVELLGNLPSDARPDLSIDAEVIVAEIKNSLSIKRPSFAQSHRDLSVFKLDPDGKTASRTTISLGQGSVRKIEIKEGLALGERIIISQHDELSNFNRILIL